MSEQPIFKRGVKSFVLRQGRLTPSQERALETLAPKWCLPVQADLVSWDEVFTQDGPLVLEIGFGMGQSLLEQAEASPNTRFVGVEVHRPGVGATLAGIEKRGLTNLRLIEGDATLVLQHMLPEGCLDRLQLFFPDPWPKKKHHKRRIVNPAFVERVVRVLKPGGVLHMATDWLPYAEHMLETAEACKGLRNLAGEGQFAARPAYRPQTKFERRGENLGHPVRDLLFARISDECDG
jgi:tRNA (guanine-N7-)-methyltransferase